MERPYDTAEAAILTLVDWIFGIFAYGFKRHRASRVNIQAQKDVVQNEMKPSQNGNATRAIPDSRRRYSSPGLRRLSPDAAKELLLRNSKVEDPEVRLMLELIEKLGDPIGHDGDLRSVRAVTP